MARDDSLVRNRRLYPNLPIIGVGALIREKGKVVLIKRGNEPSKGKWSVPGGIVELGEEVRDAVAREVLEELGLQVRVGDLIGAFENVVRDDNKKVKYHFVILDYFAEPVGGVLRTNSEVDEARWCLPKVAWSLNLTSTTRSLLRQAGFVPLRENLTKRVRAALR
ncbi:MAG: NUDIX hydrolase [Thaumarchaeota archaeon]|nr:NUDIX hydrolase [Nitrososphaerota archaeon]